MRLWHGPDDWTDGRNAGRAGRIRWYADSVLRVADKYGQSGEFVAQHIAEQRVKSAIHQIGNAFDVFFPDDLLQTRFQYLTEYTIPSSMSKSSMNRSNRVSVSGSRLDFSFSKLSK